MSEFDALADWRTLKRVATGFRFTEGPLQHPDGYWLFVDLFREQIFRLSGDAPELIRDRTNWSNGMTFDLEGRLLICESDTRRIVRSEADGTLTIVSASVGGRRYNRPNDIVTRSDGLIYFTDPIVRVPIAARELQTSAVQRIDRQGVASIASEVPEYPNGLAFSPDESLLYVANTQRDEAACAAEKARGEPCVHQYIYVFDVAPNGDIGNGRIFAEMPSAEEGAPDGLKVDVAGRVYCCGSGGCWVFDRKGALLGVIRLPEIPANCAWGGPDNRTLLFTARTSLYTLRMASPGTAIPRA